MSRTIWKGSISFGLVNIPVALYSGESRPDISLHMLDSRDRHRVRYERVNEETGEEVPWDSIVRGYEYEDGKYVLISDDEMEKVKTEVTKTVEIEAFVEAAEIDPVYFDKPYFLVPDKKQRSAFKSYALLREALRESGKVGVARVVIRSREYLCVVMAREDMLVLNVLRFAQELRDASEHEVPGNDLEELKINRKEVDMAAQLIEAMSAPWEPEQYEDSYRAALREWIEQKIEQGEDAEPQTTSQDEGEKAPGKVVDLMEYLKKSVEDAKGGKKPSVPKKKTASKKKQGGKRKAG